MGDLNTTPRTWTAGETVTAGMLNAELRDAVAAMLSPWTAYTPAWSGGAGNPAIGNGTIVGRYHRIGKTARFRISMTMGSTTTFGSGVWRLSLPAALPPPAMDRYPLDALAFDVSASETHEIQGVWQAGTSLVHLLANAATAGAAYRTVTATAPFTWAVGDILAIGGEYETA